MSKTKQAYLRDAKEIGNLEEGKEVVLLFVNGEQYTGIFKGLDDEDILLKALNSDDMIGLPLNMLKGYMERFK
jgi:sRNA-binding regulator protein Hfq